MRWFRRPSPPESTEEAPGVGLTPTNGVEIVPTADALARTEHALSLLASQSNQLHSYLVQLESHVDALAEAVLDRLDAPTFDEVDSVRRQAARAEAEVRRLEINVASRIDALRGDQTIDLRDTASTPSAAPTGWQIAG